MDSAVLRKHVLRTVKYQTLLISKLASCRDHCSLKFLSNFPIGYSITEKSLQAYLGDIVGFDSNHCNKANSTIKDVTPIFGFPVSIKNPFTNCSQTHLPILFNNKAMHFGSPLHIYFSLSVTIFTVAYPYFFSISLYF